METPEQPKKSILDDPEMKQLIIDQTPGTLIKIFDLIGISSASANQSSKAHLDGVLRIALIISGGAVAIAFAALFTGHPETSEKIIIPLISFAGGLGLGARFLSDKK